MEREELQTLRNRANKKAEGVINKSWKRAFIALADAANNLDAMMARTEVKEE